MTNFPEKAILRKIGTKYTYDWVAIIDQHVKPRIRDFVKVDVQPTIRGIFYFLTDSQIIEKSANVYRGMDKALTAARKKRSYKIGYIAPGTFSDNTRRIIDVNDTYLTLEDKIDSRMTRLIDLCYSFRKEIPLWVGQPNYVEIWSEKDTMTGTLYSILKDRQVRIAPNRGWSSFEFLYKNIERLQDQINKNKDFENIKDIWILYVGDFDPSGLKMDGHYEKALNGLQNKLGGLVHINFKRIALTWEQITEFNLEHLKNAILSDKDREKLENDPNGEWFENKYGSRFQIQVDTLQTLEPTKFKKLLTDEVDALYSKEIQDEILSRPEHSKTNVEIWEQIKTTWKHHENTFNKHFS